MIKIKEKFPNENFSVIYAGKNSYENSILKCLNCGREITVNTGELFRKRRTKICSKCNYLRKDTEENRKIIIQKIKDKAYNIEFFMKKQSKNGNYGDAIRFTCLKCERINEFFVGNLIVHNSQVNCQYCSGQKNLKDHIIYKQELEVLYPQHFTLLSDYKTVNDNVKVRCNNCGFIRLVKPTILLKSGFCPKCDQKKSGGEKIITKWLEDNNINFCTQKYFKNWDIGIHYFDFFLPEYNLVIEYHGIQHYNFNPYFHKTIENFNYRKEKDILKKETALNNGINYLSIKYTNYHKIEKILQKILQGSTTIPQGSRGKCLEIESFQMEEDIVWT